MGESEGKDQKGIYPSSANFTTDLALTWSIHPRRSS